MDLLHKTGVKFDVLNEEQFGTRIFERLPYVTFYSYDGGDSLYDWPAPTLTSIASEWERFTEDRNHSAHLQIRRKALSQLPKFKISAVDIDGYPIEWVKSLRNAKKWDIVGDDRTSLLKMRIVVVPVAKPYYLRRRVYYTAEEKLVAFALFRVRLPRYHLVKEWMPPSILTSKGKVRWQVKAYPTKIVRLIPYEVQRSFKRVKLPGLRNSLYYYEAGNAPWRGEFCVIATQEHPSLGNREVFIVDKVSDQSQAKYTHGDLLPETISPYAQWYCPLDSTNAILLPNFAAEALAEVEAIALRRAWKSVATREANFATELSQIGQTFSMFVHLVKRLALILTSLKNGDILAAAKGLFPTDSKAVANDYLLYQFGVRPLVEDIRLMATHLTHFFETNAIVHAEGHAKSSTGDLQEQFFWNHPELSNVGGNMNNFLVWRWDSTLNYRMDVRVKYSLDFEVIDKRTRDLALWGLTAPEETVWELTPFSFIVDWFSNIGDLIEQIHAADGLVPRESWKTTFIRVNQNMSEIVRYDCPKNYSSAMIPPLPSESYIWRGNVRLGHGWREKRNDLVYCVREKVDPISFQKISFKNPLTLTHVAEALALIRQLKK